jgi:hypothetical protein
MDISVHLNGTFETYKNVDIPLLYLVLRWFHMCRVLNRTAQRRMSSVDCTVQHVEKRKIAQNKKE